MMVVQKSVLFMRQWREYVQDYKDRAGLAVAERFIIAVEKKLQFSTSKLVEFVRCADRLPTLKLLHSLE